mgnify:CR=1 FL=1
MTQIKKNRIIIGGLVALVLILGFGFWLTKYFEVLTDMSQNLSQNPLSKRVNELQQSNIDLSKLETDYLSQSQSLVSEYLTQASVAGADLAVLSSDYQAKMLALTLPARYKESHLAQVLLLGEIAELSQDGKTNQAISKLEALRNFKVQ